MKAILIKVQNLLIYIGYAAGTVLLLENMAKIIRTGSETGTKILLFSTFFWFISFLSRKFVFDNHVHHMTFAQKVRLELMYYVFCHTFVILFVTSILKYTPFGYSYVYTPTPVYSGFLNYFTNQFVFVLLVHFLGLCLFLWFLTASSNMVYKCAVAREKFVYGNAKKVQFIQSVIFAIMLALSLGLLNIPIVWKSVNIINNNASLYLKTNFGWVIDYVLGSPVLYYAYTSIKGSDLVEQFSLYRKIV